jgi:hypothetical protein
VDAWLDFDGIRLPLFFKGEEQRSAVFYQKQTEGDLNRMDNQERASYGAKVFAKGNPDHKDTMRQKEHGLETSASDTVANILHYVREQGGDAEMVLRMATNNYEAEIDEEGDKEREESRQGSYEWSAQRAQ